VTAKRGIFISFEGGEGTGKSTHMRRLAMELESLGHNVSCFREPGGTIVGEAVRAILLDPEHEELVSTAELILYEAARAQLIAERITPALEAGDTVLCDRFFDSSTAYQGHARGLPLEDIATLNRIATGGLRPDLTVILSLDPIVGIERATPNFADRIEAEDISFHVKVHEGYLTIAAAEPDRCVVIDASGTIDEVYELVKAAIMPLLAA